MLEPAEFELVVNEAFANSEESICGWERLADAQTRIVQAVDEAVAASNGSGDIAIVSHGGVGTLLICKLKNIPITRTEDQQGQGHYFKFNIRDKELVHTWQKIDEIH
jgi:broad specificity phosphatase PhoE